MGIPPCPCEGCSSDGSCALKTREAAEIWQLLSDSQGFLVALSRQFLEMSGNILSSRMQRNKRWSFFPASGRTESENFGQCGCVEDTYAGPVVSPLKSNLFNISIKQVMHCWHGGKEHSLTVLIVKAMWIKFSIIYSFNVTCLRKKMRYDKGYYNLLKMFDKSRMENKRSPIEKAHKFLL